MSHFAASHGARRALVRNQWFPINDAVLNACWTLYVSDPTVAACRSVVLNELLSMGVMFADTSYSRLSSERFFNHVQKFFGPFCRAAIDSFYVQGFVAYTLNKRDAVPTVIAYGLGTYMMRVDDDFRFELGFFEAGQSEPSKDVFFEVERMPDASGTPCSAMVAYFRARTFKDEIERTVTMAEVLRSRPPIYTTTESKKAFSQQSVYDASLATREGRAQNMMAEERERANMLLRNRLVMEQFTEMDDLVRALNARGIDSSSPGWIDPSTGLPTFGNRDVDEMVYCPVVPLPADAVVAHAPVAHSRGDLVAIQEHTARLACMVMGVPPFSVGLATASFHTNATTNTLAGMLHMTVNRFRHTLSTMLVDIYEVFYETRRNVTVVFPSTQDYGRMSDLFSKNVLTYDAYRAFVSRSLELSPAAFEPADPRVAPPGSAPPLAKRPREAAPEEEPAGSDSDEPEDGEPPKPPKAERGDGSDSESDSEGSEGERRAARAVRRKRAAAKPRDAPE